VTPFSAHFNSSANNLLPSNITEDTLHISPCPDGLLIYQSSSIGALPKQHMTHFTRPHPVHAPTLTPGMQPILMQQNLITIWFHMHQYLGSVLLHLNYNLCHSNNYNT
jgi:hypothetical protein